MSSMVEKVAQAIADNINAALPEGVHVDAHYAALAAIDAMTPHVCESCRLYREIIEDKTLAYKTLREAFDLVAAALRTQAEEKNK